MTTAKLRRRAEATAALLKAVAEPTRLLLLAELARRERTGTELAAAVGGDLAGTLRHLKVLADAGLVRREKDGRVVTFALPTGHVGGGVLEFQGVRVPLPVGRR